MRRLILGWIVAFATTLAVSASSEDRPPSELTGEGAVMQEDGGGVSLNIELTRPVGWRIWLADGPPRVVLELNEMEWTDAPELRTSSVLGLHVVDTGPYLSELHAILREPLGILSAEMIAAEDGTARLDIRLTPITADAWQADVETAVETDAKTDDRIVVAIDPGHGGTDPGAESGDLREADLVLDFAKRLQGVLVASGQFEAVLTRSDDSLLSLDARLSRARQEQADVFLSFHADALAVPGAASGIVLYHLAPSAEQASNMRIQERHAPDDQLTGLDLSDAGEDVTLALLDLARQDTEPRTKAMSTSLLGAFQSAEIVVNSRPERPGSFAVLKAADIPSLLIELGFLSTKADLERLTSEDWQTEVAEAIRDGLILWAQEDRLR